MQIACPKCRQRFAVPPQLYGKQVACSNCGAPLQIPTASQASASQPAASQPQATSKPQPSRRPSRSTRQKQPSNSDASEKRLILICSLVGGGFLLLFIGVMVLRAWFASAPETPIAENDSLAETPAETSAPNQSQAGNDQVQPEAPRPSANTSQKWDLGIDLNSWTGITLLIAVNLPVYLFLAWVVFDTPDRAGLTFLETMLYLGKRLIPLLLFGFYFIVDEDEGEGAGALHLLVFVIACIAVTWGEHWLLQTYVLEPSPY